MHIGGEILAHIREMREQAGLTQEAVAAVLKIDRSTVAKWDSGDALPRADKLVQIATLYNCTVSELLTKPDQSA